MNEYTYEKFIEICKKLQLDLCDFCNKKVELSIEDYKVKIDNIEILVKDFPQLKCTMCGATFLSDKSKMVINYAYNNLLDKGLTKETIKPKNYNKQYEYCKSYSFLYDFKDYENIPGLMRPENDGFLTPVYFKKEILLYFMHHPDYELKLFSETYGSLSFKDEFNVPFGINTDEKVIFWLGDLERLDPTTITILKANNIVSDHTLIDSEFYDSQIMIQWSEPIDELKIVNFRNKLFHNIMNDLSISLYHLDDEVLGEIKKIIKPIVYNETEIKNNISALHKILIEAVSIPNFKAYYEQIVKIKEKNYKSWQSIKYFEFLLKQYADKTDNVKELISPLYLLNDLRIVFFHLLSNKSIEEKKANIVKTLNITSFDETEDLYKKLLTRLITFYDFIIEKHKENSANKPLHKPV